MIRSYRDLEAHKLSLRVYPQAVKASRRFPHYLKDQFCRAVNAIAADVAEGYGRSAAEFKMYLTRALGSCNEAETHLQMAYDAEYITEDKFVDLKNQLTIIGKKLYTLRKNWK